MPLRAPHVITPLVLLFLAAGIAVPYAISRAVGEQSPVPRDLALGGAFTFQGRLDIDGVPANGAFDFRFSLHSDPVADTPAGSVPVLSTEGVQVANGVFTVLLDFGDGAFDGNARWLQVEVEQGADVFVLVGSRQELTATPYALWATAGPFWNLGGNAGTTAANFLGTTDNVALDLRVNGARALRFEPGSTPNLVGGHSANRVSAGVVGATIAGGGASSAGRNEVLDNFGTIGGGSSNIAGGLDASVIDSEHATVGGGNRNVASSAEATVGGGSSNRASGVGAFIGGGGQNIASGLQSAIAGGALNEASGFWAAIGGGRSNIASNNSATVAGGIQNVASGNVAVVGGGASNLASGDSSTLSGGEENTSSGTRSTVGGGFSNQAVTTGATIAGGQDNAASGTNSTVGGGTLNSASANGSTVPGGSNNVASGTFSFAAGNRAKATAQGAFAWADNRAFDYTVSTANAFGVRATGGFEFIFAVNAIGVPTKYCELTSTSGSWACFSDRNQKTNFAAIDGRDILAKLEGVPILQWEAKDVDDAPPHIGPMAQDFYAAFGLGDNDTTIATIDLDGVSLAAIKGLYEISKEQADRIADLESQVPSASGGPRAVVAGVATDGTGVAQLEARLAALEASTTDGRPGWQLIAVALGLVCAGFGLGRTRSLGRLAH